MTEHSCPDCGLVHDVSTPIAPGAEAPTNEHDVAIAEAEAEAVEAVAEAGVEIAKVEAEARVETAQAEAEARVAETGERGETEVAVAEISADAREAEAEAEIATAEALAEVADAGVAIAEAGGDVVTEPMHEEPDGDEAPEVMAVAVPPQIKEGGRPPSARTTRTVSRFAARRGGHR